MGAPGSFYWTGSVFVYNTTANTIDAYTDSNNQVKFGSYLGTLKYLILCKNIRQRIS